MSKMKKEVKLPVNIENLVELLSQPAPNWKLARERDGLTKHSVDIMWIEFNDDGTFKAKHDKPAIGRSLIMSPFNEFFTWQTTPIVELLEDTDGLIKFKTGNSNYTLTKIEQK